MLGSSRTGKEHVLMSILDVVLYSRLLIVHYLVIPNLLLKIRTPLEETTLINHRTNNKLTTHFFNTMGLAQKRMQSKCVDDDP